MTTPGNDGFMPPADYRNACCADPAVGGCPHPLDDHADRVGPCGDDGCNCQAVHPHPAQCVHVVVAQQYADGDA